MPNRPTVGLLLIEKEQFSLRRGLVGAGALVGVIVLLAIFGIGATAAVLGALVAVVSGGAGPPRVRIARATAVTAIGTVLTIIGVWSGERGWVAAVVVAVVAFAATAASAWGKPAATGGFMLTLWLLVSLMLADSTQTTRALAGSFLVGGLLVIALLCVLAWRTKETPDAPPPTPHPARDHGTRDGLTLLSNPDLVRFAIVRAVALGATTLIGWYAFDVHRYWPALICFVIIKSDPAELISVAVHRAVGTVAGAVVGVELVRLIDSRPVLAVLLIVAAALAIAFSEANYAIYTFFITAVIVLSTRLVQADVSLAASERVWATLLGVLIAIITTAVVLAFSRRHQPPPAPAERSAHIDAM